MPVHATLETYRRAFSPEIPSALRDILHLGFVQERRPSVDEEIRTFLPHLEGGWVYTCARKSLSARRKALRIGVLFSGGPAPGGHSVVAGLFDAMQKWNVKSEFIGFLDGPSGLLHDSARELRQQDIDAVRNTGGFSLLGTGRLKIESEREIARVAEVVCARRLDGLVCIGGDDSNTDAALLAEAFLAMGVKTCVIGVPKTIDGDLQSPDIPISFGFDTACKVYSVTIGNIAKDCLSAQKHYFFLRLMGRAASHITLECALRTQPNLALISEEVAAREMTLFDVVRDVANLVEERYGRGRRYGLILVPEGIIEQMSDVRELVVELNDLLAPSGPHAEKFQTHTTVEERIRYAAENLTESSRQCLFMLPPIIQEQLVVERDPHGNVQVSQIETARMLALAVQKELSNRAIHTGGRIPFAFQTGFCGYEGRSAFPSNFDCTYCYALGRLSAALIANKMTGYMAAMRDLHKAPAEWLPVAVPLASLLHFERRFGARKPVIRKTLVDLSGPVFRRFADVRDQWRLDDCYLQPGPMQFFGPDALVNDPCLSISIRSRADFRD
jgi:pyrophosphate--fructose-6-phosphate 1-phosphotransferase